MESCFSHMASQVLCGTNNGTGPVIILDVCFNTIWSMHGMIYIQVLHGLEGPTGRLSPLKMIRRVRDWCFYFQFLKRSNSKGQWLTSKSRNISLQVNVALQKQNRLRTCSSSPVFSRVICFIADKDAQIHMLRKLLHKTNFHEHWA